MLDILDKQPKTARKHRRINRLGAQLLSVQYIFLAGIIKAHTEPLLRRHVREREAEQ